MELSGGPEREHGRWHRLDKHWTTTRPEQVLATAVPGPWISEAWTPLLPRGMLWHLLPHIAFFQAKIEFRLSCQSLAYAQEKREVVSTLGRQVSWHGKFLLCREAAQKTLGDHEVDWYSLWWLDVMTLECIWKTRKFSKSDLTAWDSHTS